MNQKLERTFTAYDPTVILARLVSLKDIRVLAYHRHGSQQEIEIEQVLKRPTCPRCESLARVKERPRVRYIDLPVYGRSMSLLWRKHRWYCPNVACDVGSWTSQDKRIAAQRCQMTTRAAKWATQQVGMGRTISEVAAELGCSWHTVNDAVTMYGQVLLQADRKRLNKTHAIGLDETSFVRIQGHRTSYVTTVCDVEHHQIIDIIPSCNYIDVARYLKDQPNAWKARIRYATLDMSPTYRAVYNVVLPQATQIADHFHVITLANRVLDTVRRRVQNQTLGHRGHKKDPLYKIRRLLTYGSEKLLPAMVQRLESMLVLGDPHAEVAIAYRIKERLREFYQQTDLGVATTMLAELIQTCLDVAMPPEIQQLGRTLQRWQLQILAYHQTHLSNSITEALNNLIKRIKRIGFGFTNFNNYRIRALLYAGKPNWRLLHNIFV
ncbi:ISL3 family transposase [Arcanobacterium pinnipediorum]|uniref:ISL3 family transposase n=3 Tax=Arcanobacterium TaxID=28263 RepID=A0ABY5AIA3_9ACTO|nr:ISL3 family transposase [Arcanobacterium pinnipediorum]USR78821.1 ISL3 family transposase [Arcanobacterium pinnipediorum]USR79115.1 ISL3 family transposase [Arcanobacterium pinnipediorum]USR79347.1 ISL3 family transposase [Arcanobacterium pinnipediorum]USR79367.1 ISL3 family transposase [Arcanobacterium pinnipediorum]USR79380.1 ISL3 family transposase [Arcanobacterium pinnipediorum]